MSRTVDSCLRSNIDTTPSVIQQEACDFNTDFGVEILNGVAAFDRNHGFSSCQRDAEMCGPAGETRCDIPCAVIYCACKPSFLHAATLVKLKRLFDISTRNVMPGRKAYWFAPTEKELP